MTAETCHAPLASLQFVRGPESHNQLHHLKLAIIY
uniref:Uncharacterized protein n=1 Tax=Talaromyces marneffei PM1 TaxID=1077442 RepID=A0A093XME6_TALMA